MKCPNCGKEIANGSRFCEFCGNAVKPKNNFWVGLVVLMVLIAGGVVGYMMYMDMHRPLFRQVIPKTFELRSDDSIGVSISEVLLPEVTPIEWTASTPGVSIDANGYLHVDSATYEARPSTRIRVRAELGGKEYEDSILVHLDYIKVEKPKPEPKKNSEKSTKTSTKAQNSKQVSGPLFTTSKGGTNYIDNSGYYLSGSSNGRLKVMGNGVRLRVGPGLSYRGRYFVNKGTILTSHGLSSDPEWYEVEYQGMTLYIHRDYVQPIK